MSKKKRYIITFEDGSFKDANSLLGLKENETLDAVEIMSTDYEIKDSDAILFDITEQISCTLSEAEKNKLSKDKRILCIEEDIEMYALDEDLNQSQEEIYFDGNLEVLAEEEHYFDQEYEFENKAPQEHVSYSQSELIDLYYNNLRNSFPYPFPLPIPPYGRFPWPPFRKPRFPKQAIPWNIKLIKADKAWRKSTGLGVKVAVLDTGIASHRDLRINGGVSFVSGVTSYNDGHGHGTHCAGIIAARNNPIGVVGVAPHAKLYGVKVLSDSGSGQTSWILAGLSWCVRNNIDVASLSLGASVAERRSYTIAIKRCMAAGVTVVCAAGNSYRSSFKYVNSPANSPGAIAVSATDSNSRIASFSSRGGASNQVTISAPGVKVKSTYLNNGYKSMSGTSMACPHIAGAAALIKQMHRNWTPIQIATRLNRTATDLGYPGNDTTYGSGLVNCFRATL